MKKLPTLRVQKLYKKAFVAFLVLTMVLWVILFNGHLQAFEAYQQDWIKRIGSEPDFEQWWTWGNGGFLLASVFGIFLGWVFVLASLKRMHPYMREEKEK